MPKIVIFLLFILTSCAGRIEVITPASNFIIPEANGENLKTDINLVHKNGSLLAININETTGKSNLDIDKSTIAYGGLLNMGLSKYIDFYISPSTHSPHIYGFKIQLKGDPVSKAEKRNFSIALNMGVGQNKYSGNDNINFTVNTTVSDYKLNRTHTAGHIGLGFGYRFDTYLLTYLHLDSISENVHGRLEYEENPSNGDIIDIDGNHLQTTLGAMYIYKDYKWGLEIARQNIHWTGIHSESITSINFLIGKYL